MVKVHSYILVISHSSLVHHIKEYNPNAILVNPSTPYLTLVNPSSPYWIHIYVVYLYPPEKYGSQIGSSSNLLGKIKAMFQTTNQIRPSSTIYFPSIHGQDTPVRIQEFQAAARVLWREMNAMDFQWKNLPNLRNPTKNG